MPSSWGPNESWCNRLWTIYVEEYLSDIQGIQEIRHMLVLGLCRNPVHPYIIWKLQTWGLDIHAWFAVEPSTFRFTCHSISAILLRFPVKKAIVSSREMSFFWVTTVEVGKNGYFLYTIHWFRCIKKVIFAVWTATNDCAADCGSSLSFYPLNQNSVLSVC
jgi:hypothetical protein